MGVRKALSTARRSGAVMLLAMGLAGCGGGTVPPDNYYRLVPPADVAQRTGGPLPGAVEVQPLRADGLLNDRAILYHNGPARIDGYSYHFWWQAPGTLLQQSLIDDLRTAHAFETVAGPEMKLDRTYEIVGRIRHLEQGTNNVDVEVELSLRAANGDTLLLKSYQQKVPISGEAVQDAVVAFSTAVGNIWADFVRDLEAITPQPRR